jgi:hypothetical protein
MLSNDPNTDSAANLEELLLKLEQRLMDSVFLKDRARVSELLAEDFREFGSSGRVWSRDEILNPSETRRLRSWKTSLSKPSCRGWCRSLTEL